jgi:hypothetical protein
LDFLHYQTKDKIMNITQKAFLVRILIGILIGIAACMLFVPTLIHSTYSVSALTTETFGPACGAATIDGIVDPSEWSSASTQTFQMVPPGSADPFTATLYVMNSGYYLYMGITINDDEFSTSGTWLPQGDSFRIDFDNDHSGALFTVGDDNLDVHAGLPQFEDRFLEVATSSGSDAEHGGTSDGAGAASRVGGLNHFELRHPLCSGDALDFCLHPADVVGFRLEYLDAQGDGSFGGSQYYPNRYTTSIADIVIGTCSAVDLFTYLPFLWK